MISVQDQAHFYRPDGWDGIELMHAHWVYHTFPKHFHDCYTIGINDAGMGSFECRHQMNPAFPGTLNLIAPGETHNGQVADGGRWIYRDLYISVERMRELAADVDINRVPAFRSASVHDAVLASRFRQVIEAMSAAPESRLEQDYLLLGAIRRLFVRHAEPQATDTASRDNERRTIERVREFLYAHSSYEITIASLARLVQCSPYHLIRVFSRGTGMTPHAYQNALRVNEAQKQLRNGYDGVQVALACGFYDQSHMIRMFRRILGATPGQYRRQRAILSKM
jgi:AraC-like DNA-binding protein